MGFFWGGAVSALWRGRWLSGMESCVFTGFPAVRCTELAFLSFCICKTSVIDGRSELLCEAKGPWAACLASVHLDPQLKVRFASPPVPRCLSGFLLASFPSEIFRLNQPPPQEGSACAHSIELLLGRVRVPQL